MKKILKIALLLFTTAYIGGAWYFSGEIVKFKTNSLQQDRTNLKINSYKDFGLLSPQEFQASGKDILIKGWLFQNPKENKCAVITSHGLTGTRYGGLKYGRIFWKIGCHVLAIDSRYHGESGGNFETYGYFEKYDLEEVAKELSTKINLPINKIGLVGESLGGAISLLAASSGKKYLFVLADSPFSDAIQIFKERGKALYGSAILFLVPTAILISNLRAGCNLAESSPIKYSESITSPVLLIHSKSDDFTSYSHSQKIFNTLKVVEREIQITEWGAGHGQSVNVNPDGYERTVREFWNKYIKI